MELFSKNIAFLLQKRGEGLTHFLSNHSIQRLEDLPLSFWIDFARKEGCQLTDLMQFSISVDRDKLRNIKLLILDVDGVMTDGGMYFAESGDQFKKYNTKDGMAIIHLTKQNFQVGIISSGFKQELVKSRAELLGIQHFYVGREPKIDILKQWCSDLQFSLEEVAIIGDDINDLSVMKNVGFSACPSDAVEAVKSHVDLVLKQQGGQACVREFIDNYLLERRLGE